MPEPSVLKTHNASWAGKAIQGPALKRSAYGMVGESEEVSAGGPVSGGWALLLLLSLLELAMGPSRSDGADSELQAEARTEMRMTTKRIEIKRVRCIFLFIVPPND